MGVNELENVINGLECCSKGDCADCDNCTYRGVKTDVPCESTLMRNALALLKAQGPRVMTLEEIDDIVTKSNKEHERIFWAEVKSRTRYSFGVFQLDLATNDDYEALLLGCAWPAWYRRSSYGFRWRCWTSRPTDEQREAVNWR